MPVLIWWEIWPCKKTPPRTPPHRHPPSPCPLLYPCSDTSTPSLLSSRNRPPPPAQNTSESSSLSLPQTRNTKSICEMSAKFSYEQTVSYPSGSYHSGMIGCCHESENSGRLWLSRSLFWKVLKEASFESTIQEDSLIFRDCAMLFLSMFGTLSQASRKENGSGKTRPRIPWRLPQPS